MPYLVCSRCSARSYATTQAAAAARCPVCERPLRSHTAGEEDADASSADWRLADRHRAGDPAAFAALHARYAPSLRMQARRLVGEAHADDVVQDAFVRAHRFLLEDPRARQTDLALGGWLHTVVRHRCVDELRRGGRTTPLLDDVLTCGAHGPHDLAVQSEELRVLRGAVGALPLRQREALVGHVLNGEPHAVVAGRLDTSVSATKSLINRARLSLRHAAVAAGG